MIYHNAVKKLLTTPRGQDLRSSERVSLLCRTLSIPNKGLTVVKILGESGKSACAAMLSRALLSAGYRVGTLTTPFSHTMTECISVDCRPVSMDAFTDGVNRVCAAVCDIRTRLSALSEVDEVDEETLTPTDKALRHYRQHGDQFSPFSDELLLAAALLCFADAHCQIAVIEVPSDNGAAAYRLPIAPTVSVITSTEDTATAARICRSLDKRTRETVTALQSKEVYSIISDACAKINCRLSMPLRSAFYPVSFAVNRMRLFYKDIDRSLHTGAYYQALNFLTVSETLEALRRQGLAVDPLRVDYQPIQGYMGVPLQFAFLSLHPTILCDFADTPSRLAAFSHAVSYQKAVLGSKITVIAQAQNEPPLSDDTIVSQLATHDIAIEKVIRVTPEEARRALKPVIKAITADDTLFVLGSRPFVYEVTRAIQGLMA